MRGLEVLPRGGQWRGARVGVLGLGRSGRGALRLLARRGASASAFDDRIESATLDALHDEGLGHVDPKPARDDSAALVQELDVLVVSPGVPGNHPMVAAADIAGVVVISELELAWRCTRGDVIAVTGTNGKSTTVTLIHELLVAGGLHSILVGNIGIAFSDEAGPVDEGGVFVVECSSFQLERIMDFHPRVAAVLNIAPDHLDRYDSFEAYVVAKHNLLRNQLPGDLFVYPAGDHRLEEWARVGVARAARFSAEAVNGTSAWIEDGMLMRANGSGTETEVVCPVSALRLIGQHNLLNITAALAAISPWKVPVEKVAEVLRRFEALPHRSVRVPTDDGRTWIDDSKATNVHAASATLAGVDGPVVLLVGGSDKNEDYTPLASFADRIRAALCFGAEAERLQAALGRGVASETFGRMVDALERAKKIAEPGDTILLSPACASFDEFSGFAERGEVFTDWVRCNAGGLA